jgi:hypothetical protein
MLSEVRRRYPGKQRRRWLQAEGRTGLTSLILAGDDDDDGGDDDDDDNNEKFITETFPEVHL